MKRFTFGLYLLLSVSILLAASVMIYQMNWASVGMSVLTLFFLSLPFLIEKQLKIKFPRSLVLVFLLFFYAAIFLGTANHFYTRFWWWDKMLHSFSGIIFANLGLIIASYLQGSEKKDSGFNPVFLMALFTFCFAVASGAVWEIYEYTMDKTFGFLYQGVGIDDTMTDIICDTLGALIFALFLIFRKRKAND